MVVCSSTESYVQYHLHLLEVCVRGLISIGLSRLFISLLHQYVAILNIWLVFTFCFFIFGFSSWTHVIWHDFSLSYILHSCLGQLLGHDINLTAVPQCRKHLSCLVWFSWIHIYWVCNVPDTVLGTKFYMWKTWHFSSRI